VTDTHTHTERLTDASTIAKTCDGLHAVAPKTILAVIDQTIFAHCNTYSVHLFTAIVIVIIVFHIFIAVIN